VAAPGQLSAVEIEQVRVTLGLDANPFSKPPQTPQKAKPPQTEN